MEQSLVLRRTATPSFWRDPFPVFFIVSRLFWALLIGFIVTKCNNRSPHAPTAAKSDKERPRWEAVLIGAAERGRLPEPLPDDAPEPDARKLFLIEPRPPRIRRLRRR